MSSKGIRDIIAEQTEQEILTYLRQQKKAVSFYKLYTDLNYTSGKAQSALQRLQEKGLIYQKKKISKFQTYVLDRDFDLEPEIIKNLEEDVMIFPFSIPYWLGVILKQIPKISDEYGSFMEIVKKSIEYFFKEKLPYDLRKEAVLKALGKGKISEDLAKMLGVEGE